MPLPIVYYVWWYAYIWFGSRYCFLFHSPTEMEIEEIVCLYAVFCFDYFLKFTIWILSSVSSSLKYIIHSFIHGDPISCKDQIHFINRFRFYFHRKWLLKLTNFILKVLKNLIDELNINMGWALSSFFSFYFHFIWIQSIGLE